MKRKVFVKQMKMLKEKSKSPGKDKQTEQERRHSTTEDSPGVSESVQNESQSELTEISKAASTVAFSSSTWPATALSPRANSGPLPTVDVLMKNSSVKAFQLKKRNDAQQEDEMNADNLIDNKNQEFNKNHSQTIENNDQRASLSLSSSPSTSSSLSPYTNNEESIDNNQNVEKWVRDCSAVGQISNPSLPKLIQHSLGIEYSMTYNVNLDQTEPHTTEIVNSNGIDSPSPVFHQLQSSRLNDTAVVKTEMTSDMSEYCTRTNNSLGHQHSESHGHYIVLGTGSQVIHPRQHSQFTPSFNHSSANHSNFNDEYSQEHHGQVRAWEQENYRYVDFTWRHGDENESMYSESKSADEESNHVKHGNTNVLDESVDLSNKTTRPVTRTSGSGSSRRRRKRVQTPVQRSAANMRERRRMCHLNVAFDYLKEHLPNVKDRKKLSRIQTLKAAIYYIHLLQDSLNVQ